MTWEDEEYTSSLEYVADTVAWEGFHYAFMCYSDFRDVKDEEFHKLRTAYIEAASNLSKYLEAQAGSQREPMRPPKDAYVKVDARDMISMLDRLINFAEEEIDALEHESGYIPVEEQDAMHDNLMQEHDKYIGMLNACREMR